MIINTLLLPTLLSNNMKYESGGPSTLHPGGSDCAGLVREGHEHLVGARQGCQGIAAKEGGGG